MSDLSRLLMRLLGALCLCVAAGLSLPAASRAGADLGPEPIRQAARQAAQYLISVETAEGRFLYEFDFLAGRFGSDDNIVRQAAAGYALSQFAHETKSAAALEPASRAIGYYAAKSLPFRSGKLVAADGTPATASSGATALALLAELYRVEATGDASRAELRRAWLMGLEDLQLPDGGFPANPPSDKDDSYSNGEVWLALATYDSLFPGDADLAAVLDRADRHLMQLYAASPDRQFAHWGLMAAARRHAASNDPRFLDFVAALAKTFATRLVPETAPTANSCTIVEGLTAATGALGRAGRDPELVALLTGRLRAELAQTLALQLKDGQTRISFGPDRYYADPKIANFAGAFLNSGTSLATRIDFTQHCLSALLQFDELQQRQ
jgi:hypothetical protein